MPFLKWCQAMELGNIQRAFSSSRHPDPRPWSGKSVVNPHLAGDGFVESYSHLAKPLACVECISIFKSDSVWASTAYFVLARQPTSTFTVFTPVAKLSSLCAAQTLGKVPPIRQGCQIKHFRLIRQTFPRQTIAHNSVPFVQVGHNRRRDVNSLHICRTVIYLG